MFYERDTIAAVSTPHGTGGIGIIRISGKDAVCIADGIFHSLIKVRDMDSHTIRYGKVLDENGIIIDEVMLTKMLTPSTYTKEDIIEINCHGNIVSQRKILSLIYRNGARPAEPGEFTKRAFLNGRIDLTQAEAVIDVINSKTSKSHEAALSQLEGKVSSYLKNIIDRLLTVMARIEVTVDYPEHDDEFETAVVAREEISEISDELKKALSSYNTGRLIKSGIQTTIIGKPNVGKSTLLNELAGFSKAIVTDIPGTTRDIIEEEISVDGILLNLKDTAGIRETEDYVEQIGVERAKESVRNSDLIIYVISMSDNEPVDNGLLEEIKEKKAIVILNKEDLADRNKVDEIKASLFLNKNTKIITTSLTNGKGVEEIKEAVKELFMSGHIFQNSEIIITAERHSYLIEESIKSLYDAVTALDSDMPLDMISIDIKNAADFLGEIIGLNISEDLIDRIFETFCLGK